MPWGPNWQNHSWRSWIQKKTILKYPFFGGIVNGQFWGLIYEKMPRLTYWNKNVWSLGSKNAFEHKFWLKNSGLRATCIISINKEDPVYFSDFINLCSHIVLLLVIVYLILLTFIISLLLHSLIYIFIISKVDTGFIFFILVRLNAKFLLYFIILLFIKQLYQNISLTWLLRCLVYLDTSNSLLPNLPHKMALVGIIK